MSDYMRFVVSRTSILTACFVLFFCFSVVSYTYEVQSKPDWIFGLLLVRWGLGICFCLICLCFSRNCLPYLFWFGVGVSLSFFGGKEHLSYLALALLSYAVSDQDNEVVKNFFLKGAFFVFYTICFVFLLAFLGVVESKIFINTLGFAFEVRDALGFYNPNPASLLLLSCVLIFLVLEKRYMFFLSVFVFWLCQIWLGSRTYIVVSIAVFSLYFVRRQLNYLRYMAVSLLAVVASFPILVAWIMNGDTYQVLGFDMNALLSDRLSVMKTSFENIAGLNYFPSLNFITIDPGFINLLGYMGVFMYYGLLTIFMVVVLKLRHGACVIAVIAFILSNFTENAISPYNLLSLLLFVFVFRVLKGGVVLSTGVKNENYRF